MNTLIAGIARREDVNDAIPCEAAVIANTTQIWVLLDVSEGISH
jgi:hypothetical protein